MPIIESILTQALGNLTMSTLSIVLNSGAEDDDRMQLWSIMLQDKFGEVVGILTDDQAEDVAGFLDSAEVRSTFQAHFLGRLAETERHDTGDFSERLGQAFSRLAERWCATSGKNWSSLAPDIWDHITYTLDSLFPAHEILSELTPDEIDLFREQMEVEAPTSRVRKGVPRFLRDLLDMSTNLERIVATRDTVADIRRQLKDYYAQIRLDHAQHDFRIQIDQLYIDRQLIKAGGGGTSERLNSNDIFSSSRVRIVVTGDPGIGKSTFTEYMIRQLSENPDGNITPLVINCKEFAVGGERGLITMLKNKIDTTLQLTVQPNNIEDILTLGWGLVIVDGVDEILDLSLRRRFIRAVEALAKRFPLCSIVATSRNIGYSQAQFNSARFARYELHSFTDEEIREYGRRWFSLVARPDSHLDRFFIELDSIPDLRGNPLLLSLLCVLYRARGYIPRNRRQVYSQCADLLFHRWDPMREIEQPFDHQHYGDELMQEIARWFYKSQAAQNGLEDQQLRHVIAGFLRDTASVAGPAAETRAEAFLNFCADRAWLLGVSGTTERGQRLFVFTHRTFMEFFAAESLARTLEIDDLVAEVADIYNKDASSVLPDLIIQSAEVHRRGGARQIISGLLDRGGVLGRRHAYKYLPLCLRIVNLSPVYPSLMDKIFDITISNWDRTTPARSQESTTCVLGLYRDARTKFIDHLTADIGCISGRSCRSDHSHPLVGFLTRWAHFSMCELSAPFEEEWGEFIRQMITTTLRHLTALDENTLGHFLIDAGYCPPETYLASDLIVPALNTTVAGYPFRSVERMLWGVPRTHDATVVEKLGKQAARGAKIDSDTGATLDQVLKARSSRFPYQWAGPAAGDPHAQSLTDILIWLCCGMFEASGVMNPVHDLVSSGLGLNFNEIFSTRSYHLDRQARKARGDHHAKGSADNYQNILNPSELESLGRKYRPWLKTWSQAKRNLVTYPPDGKDATEE